MIESMPIRERVLVDRDALRIERVRIGGLPIVNAVLARLGFDSLLEEYLDEPDPRCALAPVRVIGTLARNLCLGRQPLYAVKAWASEHDPALFGLVPAEAAMINDDRVGRALDELFTVDRASMCTALSLATIDRFAIALDELHDDSTSLALYGAYANATGESRAGRTPPRPARGHSKDHRPDLLTELVRASPLIITLIVNPSSKVCTHARRQSSARSLLIDRFVGGIIDHDRRPLRALSAA